MFKICVLALRVKFIYYDRMDPAGPESIVFVYIFLQFLPNKDGSGILQLGPECYSRQRGFFTLSETFSMGIGRVAYRYSGTDRNLDSFRKEPLFTRFVENRY